MMVIQSYFSLTNIFPRRSLVELFRLYQTIGSGAWKRTERLFAMIYKLFDTMEDRIKETALITLGQIGK